jgi:hypothetical protein
MLRCQYCGGKIDDGALVCPVCGESLVGVGEDTGWQGFQIQDKFEEAKHKSNMYIISAIVLVTLGIVAGGVLCVSASSVGFFGIVLVCLGIGCTGPADRYGHKARNLKRQLRQ